MKKDMLQKWTPIDNLGKSYDVENIIWGADGISFTLASSDKHFDKDYIHRFRLTWDSSHIISYHVTDETYRADCWDLDFENIGRFYISTDSDYIASLRQKSPLFPDNAIHFLIVGTDTIVDVLAMEYPVTDELK